MPCTPGITPPEPQLPAGISIRPPAPPTPPGLDVNACCKIISAPKIPMPAPIPPIAVAAAASALRPVLKQITDYLAALPRPCPRE